MADAERKRLSFRGRDWADFFGKKLVATFDFEPSLTSSRVLKADRIREKTPRSRCEPIRVDGGAHQRSLASYTGGGAGKSKPLALGAPSRLIFSLA